MIGFSDLSYSVKAIFLAITLITFCTSICLVSRAFRRKKLLLYLGVGLCLVLSGAMLLLFATHVKSAHPSWWSSPLAERVAALPVIFPILLLFIIIAALVVIINEERQFEKRSITRSSVKESLDYLNTGLCFAYKNGMVMLINHQMNHLSHAIFGKNIQNANLFWENLKEGEIRPEVTRVSMGENPSFRLPDQSVWTFSYTLIDGITQLAAAETTRLNQLTEELKERNAELEELNCRLRQYNETVEELTRARERLETKARIHRELGRTLLMMRGYLQSEGNNFEELISTAKHNLAMLRMEAEMPKNDDPMDLLMKAANSVGIKIHITGRIPNQEDAKQLFFEAASESLTNAVRHADAKELRIAFSEDDNTYSACFTNGGHQPKKEIVEGGGLSALRKKTEQIGGTMELLHENGFSLKLTLLKKGGDNR